MFRKGEIFVREGAENVPIRYAHWRDILSAYTDRIRDQSNDSVLKMLEEVLKGRASSSGDPADVPLLMGMDETTFTTTAVRLLETKNDVRLRQFIRSLSRSTGARVDLPQFEAALDKWTIFCAQSLHFERSDLVDEAIEKLCSAYKTLGVDEDSTRKRLMVVERIYVLGGLAARLDAWETIRSLALRPVPTNIHEPNFVYSSWIRNAQVYASRANLTDDPRGGFIISAARELMADHQSMRPDLIDADVPADEVTQDDIALNSLCQFDIAYCFVVAAMGTDRGSAYPSSAAFDEDRAKPMAQGIVRDADIRRRLFPDVDDATIALAIAETYEVAVRESANNYGGLWWGMPPTVDQWVNRHRPEFPQ